MKYILISSLLFLFGCTNVSTDKYVNAAKIVIDSLIIEDAQSLSEFMYTEWINDSTLKTYNVEGNNISFYKRKKKNSNYAYSHTIELPTKGYLPLIYKHNGYYYLGTESRGSDNILYKYDTTYKLIKETRFNAKLKYLNNNFLLDNNITNLLISLGDTVISAYFHNNVKYIPEYYKENSVAEFVFKNDSVISAKTYIAKPGNFKDFEMKPLSYCFNNNTVFAVYPVTDSIFSYDRVTRKEYHFALHNRDFIAPQALKEMNTGDDHYFKKLSEYELSNFRYGAIFFNPVTKHYIIFYYLPLDLNDPPERQLTFRDQKEYALILNEKFEILKYVKFNHKYFNQANYFFIPGKGLAMPVFNSKSDYENITFYIYNL